MTLNELQHKRKSLLEALEKIDADIEKEQKNLESLSPEERIAVQLHDAKCTWNHTDGCGWYYEVSKGVHNWSGSSHAAYLRSAQKLVHICGDYNKAQEVLNSFVLVKGL